jgi:hypothetical protein
MHPNSSHPTFFFLAFSVLGAIGCSSGDPTVPDSTLSRSEAIINGVKDNDTQAHNSVVALYNNGSLCTASLIAPNLIITARHCVANNITEGIGCDINGNSSNGDHVGDNYIPADMGVYLGYSPNPNTTAPAARGKQLFTVNSKNLCNSDIALLVLDKNITSVPPMKIRLAYGAVMGETTKAVGYGLTNPNQPWSSGNRYRRTGLTILSSGQDWNKLQGANEFTIGQSVCSGDSGGPMIAQATESIIGIASRVSDCITGKAHYTALAPHSALIMQAFQAAKLANSSANPILDTTPEPAPVSKKKTGEAGCSTGAECNNLLCGGTGSNKFCSAFCAAGTCTSATYCVSGPFEIGEQVISDPQQKICTPIPDGTACETCRIKKCKTEIENCLDNTSCKAILTCVDKCTDDACRNSCVSSNSGGAAIYDTVKTCSCSVKCETTCTNQCGEPMMGTGGSAGAGGTGGSGTAGTGTSGTGTAGTSTSAGGSTSTGGTAGTATSTGGTAGTTVITTGGTGGSSAAGSTGTSGPTLQPTDSSSEGGCSMSPYGNNSQNAWGSLAGLLALGWLAKRRNRKN